MNRQIRASQFLRLCKAWNTLSPTKRFYILYLIATDKFRMCTIPKMYNRLLPLLVGTFSYWAIYTLIGRDVGASILAVPVACLVSVLCTK